MLVKPCFQLLAGCCENHLDAEDLDILYPPLEAPADDRLGPGRRRGRQRFPGRPDDRRLNQVGRARQGPQAAR